MSKLRRWWWRVVRRYEWEICDACGRPAARGLGDTYWFAPNSLWNEVEGGPNGVRCPPCFDADCRGLNIDISWRAHKIQDELAAIPPSER